MTGEFAKIMITWVTTWCIICSTTSASVMHETFVLNSQCMKSITNPDSYMTMLFLGRILDTLDGLHHGQCHLHDVYSMVDANSRRTRHSHVSRACCLYLGDKFNLCKFTFCLHFLVVYCLIDIIMNDRTT